jgi:hypothetical protein
LNEDEIIGKKNVKNDVEEISDLDEELIWDSRRISK